jgi:Fe-S oxidoreductase
MGFDYGRHFGEISLAHDLTTTAEERTWRLQAPPREAEHHDVILYLGCNVLRTPHMIRTVVAIFDRLGLDYVTVGGAAYCCGIVHHRHGDTAAAGGMSDHTIELFRRFTPEDVVMWCPSCIHFYDEVRHMQLPFRVSHTTEFLAARLADLSFTHRVEDRVALHHHTTSEARRREGQACRTLLEAVPGLAVVDLDPDPRYGRSCAAAVRDQMGVAEWNRMVRDDLARARAAGASTLATIYHGCQRLICGFEVEQPLRIEHYLTVFGRGFGLEFEDAYKKYRLWADPDRILADASPCEQANGVDHARARAYVEKTFGTAAVPSPMDAAPPV